MTFTLRLVAWCITILVCSVEAGAPRNPFASVNKLGRSSGKTVGLTVDLGYGLYQGIANSTSGLRSWKGIRFAENPSGNLRWQPPQVPETNRTIVNSAIAFSPQCPQSPGGNPDSPSPFDPGDEDCLFLNVYTPLNKTRSRLPVLFWIHGGGYGGGSGQTDFTSFIRRNDHQLVVVSIQYRLGAFGFLSSEDVFQNGVVNAGLLDQFLSLQWVQTYIDLFGGDPRRVTIAGVSAGGGSVMLQAMAYNGTVGNSLFNNLFASSPYLPMQHGYKDQAPTKSYMAFASAAGCPSDASTFKCLVSKDSATLKNASYTVSVYGTYGTWAFLPVTDGTFLQDLPSHQLRKRRVNGRSILTGSNAQEGYFFVRQNIKTLDDFIAWLRETLPNFSDADIAEVLQAYPSSNETTDPNAVRYATAGDSGASALNVSESATGQQQRANNLYAEITFVCPSYWLSEAFSGHKKSSYKYQYSVVPAFHGMDGLVYVGPPMPNIGEDMQQAFSQIIGNLIIEDDPSIPAAVANGASGSSSSPASDWPKYSVDQPYQINLNQTGGQLVTTEFLGINLTFYVDPGLKNDIKLVNAYTWEAGRGARCDFWRRKGSLVPE